MPEPQKPLRTSPAQKLALRKLQDGPVSLLGMPPLEKRSFDALIRKGLVEGGEWCYQLIIAA